MVLLSFIYVQHFFFCSLSDEGHGVVTEAGAANFQDDSGANPPSFAEVSRELQLSELTFQCNKLLNLLVLTLTDQDGFVS